MKKVTERVIDMALWTLSRLTGLLVGGILVFLCFTLFSIGKTAYNDATAIEQRVSIVDSYEVLTQNRRGRFFVIVYRVDGEQVTCTTKNTEIYLLVRQQDEMLITSSVQFGTCTILQARVVQEG